MKTILSFISLSFVCISLSFCSSCTKQKKAKSRPTFDSEISELENMMRSLASTGNTKLAPKVVKKAKRMEKRYSAPNQASRILNIRIVALKMAGKEKAANQASKYLLRKFPKSDASHAMRHMKGWEYFSLKKYKSAIKILNLALIGKQMDPSAEATSHFFLALSLVETGRKKAAKPHFRSVKKLASKYPKLAKIQQMADESSTQLRKK